MIDSESVLYHESFTGRDALDDRWQLLTVPPANFVADDGVFDTTAQGLRIRASGTNELTGAPAFTKDRRDALGHLKWMAARQEQASSGFPGFDLPAGGVRVEYLASARAHGVDAHPFGDAVQDPDTDLRLASAVINLLDYETGIVMDFWVTNRAVYPFYERLAQPGGDASYQAFLSVFDPVPREPDQLHRFGFEVDATAARLSWSIDGREVATVDDIGRPCPEARVILDHGGTPETAMPRQLLPGIALMTCLDADLHGTREGLVPSDVSYVVPERFRGGAGLWGQGAEITLASLSVSARPQ